MCDIERIILKVIHLPIIIMLFCDNDSYSCKQFLSKNKQKRFGYWLKFWDGYQDFDIDNRCVILYSESVCWICWAVNGILKMLHRGQTSDWQHDSGLNFWKAEVFTCMAGESSTQSHPFSFTMCASSMINLPSLYFWLASNARSCFENESILISLYCTILVLVDALVYPH